MAKNTTRDKIWNLALTKDSIHPDHLETVFEISERTARDTLDSMHEMGWLKKTGGEGSEPVEYSSVIDATPKEEWIALE